MRFWLGFWAAVAAVMIVLPIGTVRSPAATDLHADVGPVDTAVPCERAEMVLAALALGGALIAEMEGEGVADALEAAWRIAIDGHAPHTEVAFVAFLGDATAIFLPVTNGMICSTLVVSRPLFQRIMAVVRGEAM